VVVVKEEEKTVPEVPRVPECLYSVLMLKALRFRY
jgi:hypothetical protein